MIHGKPSEPGIPRRPSAASTRSGRVRTSRMMTRLSRSERSLPPPRLTSGGKTKLHCRGVVGGAGCGCTACTPLGRSGTSTCEAPSDRPPPPGAGRPPGDGMRPSRSQRRRPCPVLAYSPAMRSSDLIRSLCSRIASRCSASVADGVSFQAYLTVVSRECQKRNMKNN